VRERVSEVMATLLVMGLVGCASEPQKADIGEVAPGFRLETVDGQSFNSDSLLGEVVVLNFWATWCQPCRKEIPELKQFSRESSAQLVTIALDDKGATPVRRFMERHEIEYPVLLGNQDVFNAYRGFGIPYTLILDREFRLIKTYRSPVTADELSSAVGELLQQH